MFSEAFESIDKDETKFEPGRAAAPTFGDSKSIYADHTRVFYNYWVNFSSCRSFAWKDVYNTTQAPNRDVRRVMEKENKRERDKARRGFNELVRRLAEFARKKDPRVMNWAKEQAAQKAERDEQTKVSKARQAAEMRNLKEAAREAQQAQLDSIDLSGMDPSLLMSEKDLKKHKHLLNGSSASSSHSGHDNGNHEASASDEDVVEEFYCPACKKLFKSDKQFKNHENSKKHKEMAAKLRKEMLEEEKTMQAHTGAKTTKTSTATHVVDELGDGTVTDALEDEDDQYIHNLETLRHTDDLVHVAQDALSDDCDSSSLSEDEAILHTIENLDQYKIHEHHHDEKSTTIATAAKPASEREHRSDAEHDYEDDEDDDMISMMATSKSKNRFQLEEDDDNEESGDDGDEVAAPQSGKKKPFNFAEFESSLPSVSDKAPSNKSNRASPPTATISSAPEAIQDPSGKKKRRRAAKDKAAVTTPAPTAVADLEPEHERGGKRGGKGKKAGKHQQQEETSGFSCRTCGSSFASKTALHTHLKETKHAIAV